MSKPTAYPVEGKPSSVAYHVNSAAYPVAVNSAAYPVAECRGDDIVEHPKQQRAGDPVERLALQRKEFGEHGGLNLSVEASTAFTVLSATTMPKIFQGEMGSDERGPMGGCYLYSRHFNPTVWALGRQLAAMEGAEAAYCTSSGLGAISSALLGMLNHGDHIVASDTLYGGTYAMLADFFSAKCGIHTSFVDMMDPEAVALACTEHTKVVYVESLSNPTLRVGNIPMLANIAHTHGARLVVDNTFTPLSITPLEHGADVVVHSLTKFINGASDIVAGAVCGSLEFIGSLMDLHTGPLMILGPTMDPQVAHSISLRVPHLPIRMIEHARRAQLFAERLQEAGVKVCYPGLPQHKDHQLFQSIGRPEYGFGGLLTIDAGSRARAEVFTYFRQRNVHIHTVHYILHMHIAMRNYAACVHCSYMHI